MSDLDTAAFSCCEIWDIQVFRSCSDISFSSYRVSSLLAALSGGLATGIPVFLPCLVSSGNFFSSINFLRFL